MDQEIHSKAETLSQLHAQAAECLQRDQAVELAEIYQKILTVNSDDVNALNGLGVLAYLAQRWSEASVKFQRAIQLAPGSAQFHLNLAKVYFNEKKHADAEKECRAALRLDPHLHDARRELSIVLFNLFRNEESLQEINTVLSAKPDWPDALFIKGVILNAHRKYGEALPLFLRVTELQPDNAKAWYAVALNFLTDERTSKQGMQAISRATQLDPSNAEFYRNYAQKLNYWTMYALAADAFDHAYMLSPGEEFSLGYAIYNRLSIGDWRNLDERLQEAQMRLEHNEKVWEPFGFKAVTASEAAQQQCARIFSAAKFPRSSVTFKSRSATRNAKVRVGYLAGEWRQHATSILITGVIESHDRNQFEIYAFDNGWDDGSVLRQRQNKAFSEIINISRLSDLEAATLIAEKEIDILIDLNGFFGSGRQEVLAFKPSPIQVSYLGCPGTMGTDYIDYLIADATVIPATHEQFYDEKIVRLPYTYQANDSLREVSPRVFTRQEMGLPAQGFVFCCFNNNYKILPATFAQWMRILQQVEGSVLWLFSISPETRLNLRREAEKRGVHPDRLVFAKPLPPPEHLARHALADLFLDTLPYNAHTTASDALWMGLPLITLVGTTFPGRVAASLLTALGVPELITQTPEAYEALAVELASDSAKLKAVKAKIISQRTTAPLFNTKLFTRHLEQAFQAMHQRHQSGLPPAAITIK